MGFRVQGVFGDGSACVGDKLERPQSEKRFVLSTGQAGSGYRSAALPWLDSDSTGPAVPRPTPMPMREPRSLALSNAFVALRATSGTTSEASAWALLGQIMAGWGRWAWERGHIEPRLVMLLKVKPSIDRPARPKDGDQQPRKLGERGSLDRQVERNPPKFRLLQTRAPSSSSVLSAHPLAFGLHPSKHG
ncbi:hypothetical protein LA080_010615 [Diaporthe eres]|nr:hypothetical protein LA080_010615 [Diaporthe eres]